MENVGHNMIWVQSSDQQVSFTSLAEWRKDAADSWIVIVQSTLQGLVARAEMIDENCPVCGACVVDVDGQSIIDVESTLEFGRWLCSDGRKAMVRVPLESSVLCLFDTLPLDTLCIEPLWPNMGVKRISRDVLMWFLAKTNKHLVLRFDSQELHPDDAEWLQQEGWISIGVQL